MTINDTYEQFITALSYMLGQTIPGKGNTQVNLARAIGINPVSLNAIIKRRINSMSKREARAGESTQQSIAEYYGMDIAKFLELGKRVSTGQQPANMLTLSSSIEREEGLMDRTGDSLPAYDLVGNLLPIVNDFTKAYADLQGENMLLRSILNHIPCGVMIVDPLSKLITFQNSTHRQIVGKILVDASYCSGTDLCIACQSASLGVSQAETVYKADGFNDFIEAIPLINSSSNVQAIVILHLSGQNDSGLYDQVIREQIRLNLIVDSFKIFGITVFDENMKIMKVNSNYTALTGIAPEEIPTIEAARKIWVEEETPELDEIIEASRKVWSEHKPSSFRATSARTGNKLIFYLSPLLDESGGFYGVSSTCILESIQKDFAGKNYYP